MPKRCTWDTAGPGRSSKKSLPRHCARDLARHDPAASPPSRVSLSPSWKPGTTKILRGPAERSREIGPIKAEGRRADRPPGVIPRSTRTRASRASRCHRTSVSLLALAGHKASSRLDLEAPGLDGGYVQEAATMERRSPRSFPASCQHPRDSRASGSDDRWEAVGLACPHTVPRVVVGPHLGGQANPGLDRNPLCRPRLRSPTKTKIGNCINHLREEGGRAMTSSDR